VFNLNDHLIAIDSAFCQKSFWGIARGTLYHKKDEAVPKGR
jgi:hypothetical protein